MRRSSLLAALLAFVAICIAFAAPAGAQAAGAPVREKAAPAQRTERPATPLTVAARRDTAHAGKSVSETLSMPNG
jgi:hypothetical protein